MFCDPSGRSAQELRRPRFAVKSTKNAGWKDFMRLWSCLFVLAALAPAGVSGTEPGAIASATAPAPALAAVASPKATPRCIFGTPGEAYPYYSGLPEDLWPYRNIQPYERFYVTRLAFLGPGRNYPPPPNLESLKIGLLDAPPTSANWERSQRTREGVVLAVEEANHARRPGQLPFELLERKGAAQWGSAANIAVEFADEGALGFIGTVDGADSHVALRVALKTEVLMINTSDPDPTLTETSIPWLLRVLPDQRLEEARLAGLIVQEKRCRRIAIMRENDRFGRLGVSQFANFIRRLGAPPVQELLFNPGEPDISHQTAAIKASDPDAILFVGEPDDIGRFARRFRAEGIKARFFGLDQLMDDRFVRSAGDAANGTVFAYFFDPAGRDPLWVDFAARFQKRWGHQPDAYAAYGYDGAQILIGAIVRAGPNRYRIRDEVLNLDFYHGVTGWMRFDGAGNNIAPVRLVRFEQRRAVFEPQQAFTPARAGRL